MRSPITTHVLDTSRGRPAAGISVTLFKQVTTPEGDRWQLLASAETDADGRVGAFSVDTASALATVEPGTYQLVFSVGDYFSSTRTEAFYADIPIVFQVQSVDEHYHVPLLLNPFGYSTYRGS